MMGIQLKDSTALVTGGGGFIGSYIVDGLVASGAREIRVIDSFLRGRPENLARALTCDRVSFIEGDIRDRALLKSLVEGCQIVFHQAALRITHCAAEPRTAVEVMIDATFDLVEQCHASGVKKVVCASSASIYGQADQFPTTEMAAPYANRTLYGAAKLFGEGLLRSYNDMFGLPYVCLRYFNVYGPRMDIHGKYTEVLVRWMERIARGEAPIVFGSGDQTVDFVYVEDVARANLLAASSDATDAAFNIGTGVETSLKQLARALLKVMGREDLDVEHAPERQINAVGRRLADVSAAQRQLGFRATIDLESGLRRLVEWWRAEGKSA
jgi:UDP-glucose 4-epimerase